jgi:hypothetical protein
VLEHFMGYDIHITRRTSWSEEGEPEVSLDEWRAVVESDCDLIALAPTPENPLTAMILSPHEGNKGARYFHYLSGQIFVKEPTKSALRKILSIARALHARVIGDEDEVYSDEGVRDRATSFVPEEKW